LLPPVRMLCASFRRHVFFLLDCSMHPIAALLFGVVTSAAGCCSAAAFPLARQPLLVSQVSMGRLFIEPASWCTGGQLAAGHG
jgi:hypothetical protein